MQCGNRRLRRGIWLFPAIYMTGVTVDKSQDIAQTILLKRTVLCRITRGQIIDLQ